MQNVTRPSQIIQEDTTKGKIFCSGVVLQQVHGESWSYLLVWLPSRYKQTCDAEFKEVKSLSKQLTLLPNFSFLHAALMMTSLAPFIHRS